MCLGSLPAGMQTPTETRIADWETQPVEDGYTGLHTLAESGFSGVITAAGTALFMLNGRTVGLTDGSLDTFETAPLTARRAPHPALSLLFAMQEGGGETRATYYTNDTPIEEAKSTLESGGFTGYIELSENVLSGTYFAVYHQGRSMSVAFVGSDDRLLTDEDAESRMHEEVGIYTVETVEITEITLPEPTTESADSGETEERSADTNSADTDSAVPSESGEASGNVDSRTASSGDIDPTEITEPASASADGEQAAREMPPETPRMSPASESQEGDSTQSVREDEPTAPRDRWGSVIDDPVEDRIVAEQRWRETNRIPSIDPDRSTILDDGDTTATTTTAVGTTPETTAEPRDELLSRTLDALDAEREAREATEETVDQLREEVTALETRLASTDENQPSPETSAGSIPETNAGSVPGTNAESVPEANTESVPETNTESVPDRSLDPRTALSGTHLFIRYESKGNATLETAHAGETDRETLGENLRLERHTEFDSANVAVEDETFESFLTDRLEYRFAEWLVNSLVFELAETGHAGSLGTLYDALPSIDRIEFQGMIEAEEQEEQGEEEPRGFDVICRDRMGEVLFVINCVDRRVPTTEEAVASLVENATETKATAPDLAGAMMVTTSYFDPGALSTAAEATRSGLFAGGSRESYVTISRRTGYHLCLVEMHDGAFHVSVPEL